MDAAHHPLDHARAALARAGVFALPELVSVKQSPQPLSAANAARHIQRTAATLGGVPPLVALGTWHLSLMAKLWTATYGVWMVSGLVPHGDSLGWSETTVTLGGPHDAPKDAEAALLTHALPAVRQLRDVAVQVGKPGLGLLEGNEATALLSTHRVVRQGQVNLVGERPHEVALRVLRGAELGHCVAPTGPRSAPWRTWQRRSCCLYYKVPGGGYCGDCALR